MEFLQNLIEALNIYIVQYPYEALLLLTFLINIHFIQGIMLTSYMMYLTAFKMIMISFIGDVVPPSLEVLFYIFLNLRLLMYLEANEINNLLLSTSLWIQISYFILAHLEYFIFGTIRVYDLAIASDLILYLNLIELIAIWYPLWKVLHGKLGIVLGPDSYRLRSSENFAGDS
jgi:hypothetical protein